MSGQGAAAPLISALRVVRERWWVILLCVAVCTGAALALALTAQKQYTATSKLLFRESSLGSALVGVPELNQNDPQRTAATNLDLVSSNAVARRVQAQLKTPQSASDLLGKIAVSTEPDSDLVDIAATDPDPRFAQQVADAFATQFVQFRKEADQRTIAQGEDLLRKRLAELPADAGASERQQLSSALQKVIAVEAVQTGNAEVIDTADLPGSPSKPRPKLDGAVGFVIGLALGLAIAFLVDLLDRRIKTVEDFEQIYGMRTLTSIPERGRAPSSQTERAAALEPFRILRNGIDSLSERRIRVVLVTSAVPSEGKSTVAAGLARAVALSGRSCVLVEADLRRPTFAAQFDLHGDARGLTTALVGGAAPSTLLREPVTGLRTLKVLPSGPLPPNAAELLRSPEMGRLLERLAEENDLVILDAPPLLPVADAQVLLEHREVDACVLVARAYKTTREEARRARAVIDRLRNANLGLVVNGIRELDSGYDYYGLDESEPAPIAARRGSSRMRA